MAKKSHDVLVLGGGSAGLTAAGGMAQLGLKTALIEKKALGGDCLFSGCVPSKTLLKIAAVYHKAGQMNGYGLPCVDRLKPDIDKINKHIQDVIHQIEEQDSPENFRKMGVEVIFSSPRFISAHEIKLDDGKILSAPKIVIATGSSARIPPIPGLEESGCLTNKDMYSLPRLPKHLVVIGGGPVGLELGQAYLRLGSKLTVIDIAERILPCEEPEVSDIIHRQLAAEGAEVFTGKRVIRVEAHGDEKRLHLGSVSDSSKNMEAELSCDAILAAVGRKGNIDDLDLDHGGIKHENGFITVDSKLRTSLKHIYALGDCNGRKFFTHAAGAEAALAIRRIVLHIGGKMDYSAVPRVTYTDPEIAAVGIGESEARRRGIKYTVLKEDFSENDRAICEGLVHTAPDISKIPGKHSPRGLVKIILDKRKRILGVHIVSAKAGDLILPAIFAVAHKWKIKRFSEISIPYPTLGEQYREIALNHYLKKIFNKKIRRILAFLFGYRGRKD